MALGRKPPAGVHVLPAFLKSDRCNDWIARLEQQPRCPLGVHSLKPVAGPTLASELSAGRITEKVDPGPLGGEINELVSRAYANTISAIFQRKFEWVEAPQVLRYEEGGCYGKHADSDTFLPDEGLWQRSLDRDISLLLYLNDDFSGGDLEFSQFNYRYSPRQGDLVFFPSDRRYVHQAQAVRWGVRYAIVSWGAFTDGPRIGTSAPPGSIYMTEDT